MFCSECGTQAAGKFCHQCGAKLVVAGQGPGVPRDAHEELIPLAELVAVDWTVETNYRALLEHDEVRARIATAGQQYQEQFTGEEVLALFDAIAPTGVPLEKLCKMLLPLYDKLGIRTGKQARAELAMPAGQVLVGVLCALASAGQQIKHVEQATDGCVLSASVPSSVWSFAGELVVSVHATPQQTIVEAATKIPGQLYDWGRGQAVLNQFFQQSQAFAA